MDSWSTARGSMPTHQYEVRGDGRGWESLGGSGAIPAGGAMEDGVEMRSGGMTVSESPRGWAGATLAAGAMGGRTPGLTWPGVRPLPPARNEVQWDSQG